MKSRPLVAVILVSLLPILAAAPARTAPSADRAREMKAAARARVTVRSPDTRVQRVSLRRVVSDYALVAVYPGPANPTAPAEVLLRRTSRVWKAVGGPDTAFPPGNRQGAPAELFRWRNPYANADARGPALRRRKTFDSARFSFGYPADAMAAVKGGEVKVTGPKVRSSVYSGPAYEITLRHLAAATGAPLDEWAYDRLRQEVERSEAKYPGELNEPEAAGFFSLGGKEIFLVDWFGFDSLRRQFYVAPKGGGPVIEVVTTVYPVQNNPAAPQAESAVRLLLQTLDPK